MIYYGECCLLTVDEPLFSTLDGIVYIYISVRPIFSLALLKSNVSYFILCLDDLSVVESEAPKTSITIIPFFSLFHHNNIWFTYLALWCWIHTGTYILVMNWPLYHYTVSLVDSVTDLDWSYFSFKYNHIYSLLPILQNIFSHIFTLRLFAKVKWVSHTQDEPWLHLNFLLF